MSHPCIHECHVILPPPFYNCIICLQCCIFHCVTNCDFMWMLHGLASYGFRWSPPFLMRFISTMIVLFWYNHNCHYLPVQQFHHTWQYHDGLFYFNWLPNWDTILKWFTGHIVFCIFNPHNHSLWQKWYLPLYLMDCESLSAFIHANGALIR